VNIAPLVESLEKTGAFVVNLLNGLDEETIRFRLEPQKWSLLEIICHLRDEEIEDFPFRTQFTLENPGKIPPPFDPSKWVEARNYGQQDFDQVLEQFRTERLNSIEWLKGLTNAQWSNSFTHPKLGEMSASLFLHNWVAYDQLHIRQILYNLYHSLQDRSEISLSYAGDW